MIMVVLIIVEVAAGVNAKLMSFGYIKVFKKDK